MGVIVKQGLKNVYSTYLGFFVGGLYTALIVPKAFSENLDYWGLARLFLSYAMIIIPWVQLSIPNIILRYFPIQNNKENNDMISSLLFWLLVSFSITFMGIFITPYFFFKDDILINTNFLLLIPIVFGYIIFEMFSALSKSMLKSTFPVFLKEFVYRVYILILVLLYWFNLIDFKLFIVLFSVAYLLILIPLLIYVIYGNSIKFHFDISTITFRVNTKYVEYGFFIMLSGGAGFFMLNIDSVMINEYLSLSDITVYTTWFFLASFLNIPTRAITAVATPIISKGINNNDLSLVKTVYAKSSIVPFTFSLLIFLIFCLNIDLFSLYLGDKFSYAKVVFIYIGLGNLVNIASGLNGTIIILSKYYKYDLFFQFFMIIAIVVLNILLIPLYGIGGAAIATAIAIVFINALRLVFIYRKFGILPFTIKTFYLFVIGFISFFIIYLFKGESELLKNMILTIILAVAYIFIIFKLKISEDVNDQIKRHLKFVN